LRNRCTERWVISGCLSNTDPYLAHKEQTKKNDFFHVVGVN
jgi:hypothetical protein